MGQILIIVAYATIFNENNFYDFFGGMDNAIKRYDDAGEEFVNDTPECNAVFYFINPIYTLGSLAFIIAYPWRKPFYTNVLLMIVVVLTLGYSTIMVIFPEASWDQFLITYLPSRRFRGYIIGISYAFGLFLYFNQKLIMEPLSAYLVKKYPHLTWL